MYDLPSRTDVVRCVVDKEVVLRKVTPTLVTEDESRRSAESASSLRSRPPCDYSRRAV